MKTLQDLYEEVMANDEEKRAFVEAMKADDVEGFLRQRGCDATKKELEEFLGQKAAEKDAPMELSTDELRQAAGGDYSIIPVPPVKFDTNGCSVTCKPKFC